VGYWLKMIPTLPTMRVGWGRNDANEGLWNT
jgi:hypothetical protein